MNNIMNDIYRKKLDNNRKRLDDNRKKLDDVITRNSRLFNLRLIDKRKDGFLMREDYHMSTGVENEIFRWGLQMSVELTSGGLIHMIMFMHPIIVSDETRADFIEFANAANLWLGSALGRFLVNDDNDYCYECCLPEFFIDYENELEQQLFDKPFSHFKNSLSPLMMLRGREWDSGRAIEFLNRLMEDGYVDNVEYGLW